MKESLKNRNLWIVLLVFPIVYVVHSFTPWASALFGKGDNDFYIAFWSGVILFHWLSFVIVCRMLRCEGKTLADIGYGLSKAKTGILVGVYLLVALLVFGFTEMGLHYVALDEVKLQALSGFFPKTSAQRFLFIGVVFTAGFCEEIVYRGFAITKLHQAGLNKWLAVIPAGISFVFIHGVGGFYQFWYYFVAAIVFGVLFVLCKRLWPGIVLHLLYDLSAMMAVFKAIQSTSVEI